MAMRSTKQSIKVECVPADVLQLLVECIKTWQAKKTNRYTDLDRVESAWTGSFYKGFLRTQPSSWMFSSALQYLTAPAPTAMSAVRVFNLRESRDLLARVQFIYNGSLSRTDAARMLPNGMEYRPENGTALNMTSELMKVAGDGTSAIITRVFHWVLWKVKTPEFQTLERGSELARQTFWFQNIDRVTLVWLLKYTRDALDLEWLVEAADLYTSVAGRYTQAETDRAKKILHMLRRRLLLAAEGVFLFMVDTKPETSMEFPVQANSASLAARYWRNGVESMEKTGTNHVPLASWPLRLELQYRKKKTEVAGPSNLLEKFPVV